MASLIIDEEKFIEDSAFKYEERINSPLVRFLDRSPVFVTYYHINNDESLSAEGFCDVENLIGENSPIKYQKISKFPVFGLDRIMVNIEEAEQGIDMSYNGEAVILPNTIKPLPNDLFIINHVRRKFTFKITDVSIDSIRAENLYRVEFKLEYTDAGIEDKIDKNNIDEKFDCILENIGSEDRCIIREDYKEHLLSLNKMYEEIANAYKNMFYDMRYNVMLGPSDNRRLYDPFQTIFINKHNLFNKRNDYNTIMLSMQIDDPMINLKYDKSVYKFIERCDVTRIKNFMYKLRSTYEFEESTFYRWHDDSVCIIDIPEKVITNEANVKELFSDEFVNLLRDKTHADNIYSELISKFLHNEIESIYDIKLTLYEAIIDLDSSEDIFFMTPIIMYIIKKTVDDFMKNKR